MKMNLVLWKFIILNSIACLFSLFIELAGGINKDCFWGNEPC